MVLFGYCFSTESGFVVLKNILLQKIILECKGTVVLMIVTS